MANGDEITAAQAPGMLPTERCLSMHTGMDTYNEPWFIQPTSGQLVQDMEAWRPGRRLRRRGASSVGMVSSVTTAFVACGLGRFYDDLIRVDTPIGIVDGALWRWDGLLNVTKLAASNSGVSFVRHTHTFEEGRWRNLAATFVSSAGWTPSDASLASRLFVIDLNREYTQSASVAFRAISWWLGRLWGAGNVYSLNDDTIWWSELLDGMSYCAINTMNIESGRGGGQITALLPVRAESPNLVIFKPRMIALLSAYWGSSSSLIPSAADALDTIKSSVVVITDRYGCVSPNSLQSIEGAEAGDYIFLGHDGFRTLKRAADDSLAGSTLPISTGIQDTIQRINFAAAHKVVSTVWDLKYWCAVPLDEALENTHILMYDLLNGGWHLFTWTVAGLTSCKITGDQDKLWMLYNVPTTDTVYTAVSGYHVYSGFEGYNDPNGIATPWIEHGRGMVFGAIDQKKRWGWFGLEVLNNSATAMCDVVYRLDNTDWFHLKTLTINPIGGWQIKLGTDKLPWTKRPPRARMMKVALDDIEPGYILQLGVGQTGASDYAVLQILQTLVAATPFDPEFDNSIA